MNASIGATKHPGDRSEVIKRRGVVVRPQPSSNRSPPHRRPQRSHQSASSLERSSSILIDPQPNDPSDQGSKPASSPSRQSDDRCRGSPRIVTSIDARIKASIEATKHPGDRSEVSKRRGGVVRPQPSSNRIPPHRSQQRSHPSASIIERNIHLDGPKIQGSKRPRIQAR